MATFKGYIFVLFLFPIVIVGQINCKLDEKKINHYINDPSLPKIVKEYYNGQFKASDDNKTFILLDTLTSKNDYFFPFYFSIFNKIANESDGALSEVMGKYCFKNLYQYPKEIFIFFPVVNIYLSFIKRDKLFLRRNGEKQSLSGQYCIKSLL